jgi:hypothetical protein
MRRRSLPLLLALVAFAPAAAAEGPSAPPPAAAARPTDAQTKAAIERQRVRLSAAMRPELRARVLTAARLLAQRLDAPVAAHGRPPDPLQLALQIASDGQSFPNAASLGSADIEALAFLVMMEAAKSADEDLKTIMAQVKAINAAKSCMRSFVDRAKARPCIDAIAPPPPMTQAELDALLATMRDQDSLDSMGEMTSLRLQMAMDRKSKFMSTLSNILKKISDTASSIISNMK